MLDADYAVDEDNLSDIGNEHLYTGRRTDPGTGLQLNRNRYYHAALGRWVNRDPIGYLDGNNLYQYVQGNPTLYGDPSGEVAALGGCAVGGTVSGGTAFAISWWNGDDLSTCACKGACAGLGGCIQGAAIAQFPSVIGGCIGGTLGALAQMGCEAGCGVRGPLNTCDVANTAVAGLLGCIGGAAAAADDEKIEIVLALVGIDYQIWSSMCRPGGGPGPVAGGHGTIAAPPHHPQFL